MGHDKKIVVIHAADADQHLGHLKKILDSFKEEKRIENYSTIPSDAVAQDSFNAIGKEDMLIMLLTNDILDKKASIEATMLDVKKRQSETRCAGVIIDNITYDPSFIAFPSSLEPIRSSEDMDAVWQGIAENLKKLFPKLVPPPPPPKTKPAWKKWAPYVVGVIALLAIFFALNKCLDHGSVLPKEEATEATKDKNPKDRVLTTFVKEIEKALLNGKQVSVFNLGVFWVDEKNGKKNVKFGSPIKSSAPKINSTALINTTSKISEISEIETKRILESFVDSLSTNLEKENEISVEGLGTWYVSIRPAKEGRNPSTGKIIKISEKRVVKFIADSNLLQVLNK